ncbi:flavodoxin family protein [Clostridium sp. PL3]|uniref:Flavodoxin family protein n=1 Tax=Clostridium thailandense TaxID=2794346 RepID=A0A949U4B5_9CLOT|nr:flavodoxin family protein [Clostridium thailandense]MBV7276179.1 flavodoxin family protein [Clostridium thailandense]
MKILALNGSPRGKNGNTEVILKPFLKGCMGAGAEVETIYLKDKDINHCLGCFTCWTTTPGKCVHKDDMKELLNKILEADVMVYATPLYYYTVTGIMKDFMDRMLPLNNKEILKVGDNYSHPRRFKSEKPTKTVLISNCGFPGTYNFSGLIETFKVMTKGNLAGAILCSQGGPLKAIESDENFKKLYTDFFLALESAGKEIVEEGHIKAETQAVIDKERVDPEMYIKIANSSWER